MAPRSEDDRTSKGIELLLPLESRRSITIRVVVIRNEGAFRSITINITVANTIPEIPSKHKNVLDLAADRKMFAAIDHLGEFINNLQTTNKS